MDYPFPKWGIVNGEIKTSEESGIHTDKYHITHTPNTKHLEAVTPLPDGDYIVEGINCSEYCDWFFHVEGKNCGRELDLYILEAIVD